MVLDHSATYQGTFVQVQTGCRHTCRCSFPLYLYRWHFPHRCACPVGIHQYLPEKKGGREEKNGDVEEETGLYNQKTQHPRRGAPSAFVMLYVLRALHIFRHKSFIMSTGERDEMGPMAACPVR